MGSPLGRPAGTEHDRHHPDRHPNVSQQAIALPAIRAAARQDALGGAVDAVYWAALAYGEKYRDLLAAARERL